MGTSTEDPPERPSRDPEKDSAGSQRLKGAPRRWRRRRLSVIVVVLVALLPVSAYLAWGWLREGASPVPLSQAGARFRRGHPGTAQGAGPLTPAEGVYQYIGEGSDHISVPPLSQSQGPGMPGTITHLASACWNFRIDYSSHHWQDWTYCPRNDGLDEQAGRTFQRWDLGVTSVDNNSSFTCRSRTLVPGMQPGSSWNQTCTGNNSSVSGTTTSSGLMRFVGIETLRIGAERERAYHLVQQRQISGSQRGSLKADEWFAADGLPLRERHRISVSSPSPIGDVTYDEVTDFTLANPHAKG